MSKSVSDRRRRQPAGSSKTPWVLAAFTLGLLCAALLGVVIVQAIDKSESSEPTQTGVGLEDASQKPTELSGNQVGNASLTLELNNYSFKISGFVANEETRQQLEQATALVYGELGQFDVVVDPGREGVTSVQGLVRLPQNLNRLIDGSFSIAGDTLTIDGTAPDLTTKDELNKLAQGLGFTVNDQTTVANLEAPEIRFIRSGDQIDIVGDISNEQVGVILTQVISKDFGAENVNTEELFVNPAVYTRFNLITTAGTLKLFGTFGDFDVGFEENQLGGVLSQGVGFATGSTEIGPAQQAKLEVFPPLLVNLTDLSLTVTGHADNVGSDESNQALSEQRAQAIIELFEAKGMDKSRLTAVGKGASEPIAPNDTLEGRALNRRVTFQLN